jgi:type IV fimbrial biogenesis protein FimT
MDAFSLGIDSHRVLPPVPFQRLLQRAGARRRCNAFTLIEMLLGLAIAATLVTLALPFYGDWIADYQVLNHAQLLAGTMNIARTEAVKRGHRVNLCKSPDQRMCVATGGWEMGYVVHSDRDLDGSVDVGESALRVEGPATSGITIRGNSPVDDYVSYTSLGTARLLNGALQMGTITVCKPGRRAIDVVLANSGRVRIEKSAVTCP